MIIDNKLNLKIYVDSLCKKASQKIWVFARLSKYLNDAQKGLIVKSPIRSQFSYCLIVWIFWSRKTNIMIKKLHERTLRIVLNNQTSNFEMLLVENSNIFNHARNIQTLMMETYQMQTILLLQ